MAYPGSNNYNLRVLTEKIGKKFIVTGFAFWYIMLATFSTLEKAIRLEMLLGYTKKILKGKQPSS